MALTEHDFVISAEFGLKPEDEVRVEAVSDPVFHGKIGKIGVCIDAYGSGADRIVCIRFEDGRVIEGSQIGLVIEGFGTGLISDPYGS